jgi:capsular exopolysaccharide synthesis family protein
MTQKTKNNVNQEHPVIKQIKDQHLPLLGVLPYKEFEDKEFIVDTDEGAKKEFSKVSTMLSYGKFSIKTLMISSCRSKEGKTTFAVNMARALAKSRKKVLLIDCNVQHPIIHNYFGVVNEKGLVDIISYGEPIDSVIRETDLDNLSLITAGSNSLFPEGVFTSSGIGRIIPQLESKVDIVIFDMVSFDGHDETEKLAKKVDKVILVYNPNKINLDTVNDVLEKANKKASGFRLKKEIDFLGLVVNALREDTEVTTSIFSRPPKIDFNTPSFSRLIKIIPVVIILTLFIFAAIFYFPTIEKKVMSQFGSKDTPVDTLAKAETTAVIPADSAAMVSPPTDSVTTEPIEPSSPTAKKEIISNADPYYYSVHISSSQKLQGTIKEKKKFEKLGYPSFFVLTDLGEMGKWYRIFAGAYRDRTKAEKIADELKGYTEDSYAAAVDVRYSLAIGTFDRRQDARAREAEIEVEYSPYILPIKTENGQTKYNLYVGAFPKKEDAQNLQNLLQNQGIESKIVIR